MKKQILALFAVLALLLSGCTDAQPQPSAGEESSGYDFIFVCPITDVPYWQECIDGIRQADAELGTTTKVVGPPNFENFATEIIGHMETAVAQHPDAIMAYCGVEGLYPLIDQAVEEGVPVLAIDSDAPTTKRAAYLGTDLYALGYRCGETMVDLTGGQAKVGYICSSFSAQGEATAFDAFRDAIHDYHMEVVISVEGGTSVESTHAAATAMLEEHPELTAIFCTSSYTGTGAGLAKQESGRDDVMIVALDDVEENLQLVREGAINALLVQSPYQMGYQGVYLLKDLVDKGSLPQQSYDTGSILVNQDNVDNYKD